MRFAILTLLFLSFLSVTPLTAAHASAEAKFLKSLEGKWRGRGVVKPSISAPKEAIRCNIRNALAGNPNKLNQSGACSVAGFTVDMSGAIQYKPASGNFTTSLFKALSVMKVDGVIGRLRGNRLVVDLRRFDETRNKMIDAQLVVTARNANNFSLIFTETDPTSSKRYEAGNITFKRR